MNGGKFFKVFNAGAVTCFCLLILTGFPDTVSGLRLLFRGYSMKGNLGSLTDSGKVSREILKQTKELKRELGTLMDSSAVLGMLSESVKGQVDGSKTLGALLDEQMVLSQDALDTLGTVTRQTSYTDKIVGKTLRLSLQSEDKSMESQKLSQKLEKSLGVLLARTKALNKGMDGSISQMKQLRENLPKNIPF